MKPIKQVFEQPMHCCGPSGRDGTLTVEVYDGGGGEYLVIHAKHWAMDGKGEIAELVKVLTTMLAK